MPPVPSPDTPIVPSVTPTPPESCANPGISTTGHEHPATMLDFHPPHEALHTWKGFFIHIATIVIGLCIAVGLEQTVEFFHHRHQVAETREALRVERESNIRAFAEGFTAAAMHSVALCPSMWAPRSKPVSRCRMSLTKPSVQLAAMALP